jgi:hypothetical protein
MEKQKMTLKQGHLYKDKQDSLWCCFFIRSKDPNNHMAADCIRVDDKRIEYFYLDGRYDEEDRSKMCLVKEVTP